MYKWEGYINVTNNTHSDTQGTFLDRCDYQCEFPLKYFPSTTHLSSFTFGSLESESVCVVILDSTWPWMQVSRQMASLELAWTYPGEPVTVWQAKPQDYNYPKHCRPRRHNNYHVDILIFIMIQHFKRSPITFTIISTVINKDLWLLEKHTYTVFWTLLSNNTKNDYIS